MNVFKVTRRCNFPPAGMVQQKRDVGPTSAMMAQHWNNIGSTPRVCWAKTNYLSCRAGRDPGAVVKAARFESQRSRVRTPLWPSSFKETKCFFLAHSWRFNIVGSLCGVACSAYDRQGSNFESCVWKVVSSHSSHHPQEVVLAQFSPYVHKGGLKPLSFHLFILQSSVHFGTVFFPKLKTHYTPCDVPREITYKTARQLKAAAY